MELELCMDVDPWKLALCEGLQLQHGACAEEPHQMSYNLYGYLPIFRDGLTCIEEIFNPWKI